MELGGVEKANIGDQPVIEAATVGHDDCDPLRGSNLTFMSMLMKNQMIYIPSMNFPNFYSQKMGSFSRL